MRARPQREHQRDQKDVDRKRLDKIRDPQDHHVGPPSGEPCERAQQRPEHRGQEGRCRRNGQIDPRRVYQPRELVTAKVVGPEEVPGGTGRQQRVERVGFERVVRGDLRGEDCDHDEGRDDAPADCQLPRQLVVSPPAAPAPR